MTVFAIVVIVFFILIIAIIGYSESNWVIEKLVKWAVRKPSLMILYTIVMFLFAGSSYFITFRLMNVGGRSSLLEIILLFALSTVILGVAIFLLIITIKKDSKYLSEKSSLEEALIAEILALENPDAKIKKMTFAEMKEKYDFSRFDGADAQALRDYRNRLQKRR